MISFGPPASAMAPTMRWRMPPLIWCGYSRMRIAGEGMRTERNSSLHPLAQRAAAHRPMVIGRLGDLAVDAEQRVQRGHRVLQDHRDLRAADVAHLARPLSSSAPRPAKSMRPPTMRAAAGSRPTIDRQVVVLPQPRLADQAERLAFVQGEADAVDRLDDARAAERDDNGSAGRMTSSSGVMAMPSGLHDCAAADRAGCAASRRTAASPAPPA